MGLAEVPQFSAAQSPPGSKTRGAVPPIKGLAHDPRYLQPYFDKSAPLRIDLEQMPEMVPSVSWPGANRLQAAKALSDAREKIVTGVQKSPPPSVRQPRT